MNIAIDARMIRSGTMHGIARYVYHLIQEISLIDSTDHKYFIFVNHNNPLIESKWPQHIQLVTAKSSWISVREHFELPYLLKKHRIDLFHAPSYVAPLWVPCKMAMTIHDLNHLVLPQFYTQIHQLYYKIIVKRCVNKSSFIFTVSEFSKNEIIRNFDIDPQKIIVTYNGVDSNFCKITDKQYLDYVKDIYELPEEFLFCVANNKPHKNVRRLVEAYCMSHVTTPLVLASPPTPEVLELADRYHKKHLIHFVKFIKEEDLPAVYSLTKLFIYPSTYEGFGLPPLEAIACGVPVMVSESTSLPEVVGNHAIFINPYSPEAIAYGLENGLSDSKLRADLAEDRQQHVKQFSWKNMAAKTLQTYDLIQNDQLIN